MATWDSFRNGIRYGLARKGALDDPKLDVNAYKAKADEYISQADKGDITSDASIKLLYAYMKLFNTRQEPKLKLKENVLTITLSETTALFIAKQDKTISAYLGAPVGPGDPKKRKLEELESDFEKATTRIEELERRKIKVESGEVAEGDIERTKDEVAELSRQMSELRAQIEATDKNLEKVSKQLNLPAPKPTSSARDIENVFSGVKDRIEKLKNEQTTLNYVRDYLSKKVTAPDVDLELSRELSQVVAAISNRFGQYEIVESEFFQSVIENAEEYDTLAERLEDLKGQYANLEKEYQRKASDLRAYKEYIEGAQPVVAKLDEELDKATKRRDELVKQINEFDQAAAAKAEEVAGLQEQTTALQEEVERLVSVREGYQIKYDEKKKEAEDARDAADRDLRITENLLKNAKAELKVVSEKSGRLETNFAFEEEKFERVQKQVLQAAGQLAAQEAQKEKARLDYLDWKGQEERTITELTERQDKLKSLEETIQKTNKELEKLKPQSARLAKVEKELTAKEETIERLDSDEKQYRADISKLLVELSEQNRSLNEVIQEQRAVKTNLFTTSSELLRKKEALESQERRIAETIREGKEEIDKNMALLESVSTKLGEKQSLYDRLEKSIRTLYPDTESIRIEDVVAKLESLTKEIEQVEAERADILQARTEEGAALEQLRSTVAGIRSEANELRLEVEELRNEKTTLTGEVSTLKQQKEALTKEVTAKEKAKDELEAKISKLNTEAQNLVNQLVRLRGDVDKGQREVAEIKQQYGDLSLLKAELETQLKEKKAELKRLRDDETASKKLLQDLQTELQQNLSALANTKEEEKEVSEKLGTAKSDLAATQQQLQSEKQRITETVADGDKQIAENLKRLQSVLGDLKKKEPLLARLENTIQRLYPGAESIQIEDVVKRLESLTKEIEREEARSAQILSENDKADAALKELLATVERTKAEAEKLKGEVDRLTKTRDALAAETQNLQTKRDRLASEVAEKEQTKSQLEQDISSLTTQSNQLKSEVTQLQDQVADYTERFNNIKTKYLDLEAKAKLYQDQVSKATDELSRTLLEVDRLKTKRDETLQEQKKIEKEVLQLQREKAGTFAVIELLKTSVLAEENRLIVVRAALTQAKNDYTNVKSHVDDLQEKLAELQIELRKAEERKAQLNAELPLLEQRKVDLDRDIEERRRESKKLQEESKEFMDKLRELIAKAEEKGVEPEDLSKVPIPVLKPYKGNIPKYFIDGEHYSVVAKVDNTDYYNVSFPVQGISLPKLLLFFSINTLRKAGFPKYLIEDEYTKRKIIFDPYAPNETDPVVKGLMEEKWWYFLPMDYEDCESGIPLLK